MPIWSDWVIRKTIRGTGYSMTERENGMEGFYQLQGEKLQPYVHMVPEWLLKEGKEGGSPQFWGMTDGGEPCGAAVLQREEDVVTLRFLYIAEAYRKEGKGSRFLAELLYHAYHAGDQVFQVHYIPGEYPKFERLLQGYPFEKTEEKIGSFTCTLGELSENKYLQGSYGNVRALSQCTEESLRIFYREIAARGEDLVDMPVKKEAYLADACAVAMEQGKPAGLLLVKEGKNGSLEIPFLLNFSENVAAPIEMIRFAVQTGSRKYTKETQCSFAVVSETLLLLLQKMGITTEKKRQKSTLRLSYFTAYEKAVQRYLDGDTNRV